VALGPAISIAGLGAWDFFSRNTLEAVLSLFLGFNLWKVLVFDKVLATSITLAAFVLCGYANWPSIKTSTVLITLRLCAANI